MKRILTLLLAAGCALCAMGQNNRITVRGDASVSNMVQKHIELNERMQTIPGYRIQIASLSGANSKERAFDLRDRFASEFSTVQAYIIFDEPNFKVKVGDFRTRLEAYRFLQTIKDTYGGYIIKDNIYPTPLNFDDMLPESDEEMN
ncbi:MAG: SPOR domain-containing protein [Bacteroidales bacterium]|nr:SPOR domain-containing protein [Bacteroidales bacterium]